MLLDLLKNVEDARSRDSSGSSEVEHRVDAYFSADVETDGPIPGPYSLLSFALVFAGTYDGKAFDRPVEYKKIFYRELKPISDDFEPAAMAVNGLDRDRLRAEGGDPSGVMRDAFQWVQEVAGAANPVLVAFPLSFDWTFLYWYFMKFNKAGSPFQHSRCFDIKTAMALRLGIPVSEASRSRLPKQLRSNRPHTHHAVDDAIEQAEIFANVLHWGK